MDEFKLPPKKIKDNKIVIRPTPNADSRTSNSLLSDETCREDTYEHIRDVQKAMNFFSAQVARAGLMHDNTKVTELDDYVQLVLGDVKDDDFLASDWWTTHITKERHHLNANCPVDVTLIDILEMIADMVMQKGRKGYFTSDELKIVDPTLLERAYWNTVKLLDDKVIVK
jgi:hypothetical protein